MRERVFFLGGFIYPSSGEGKGSDNLKSKQSEKNLKGRGRGKIFDFGPFFCKGHHLILGLLFSFQFAVLRFFVPHREQLDVKF